MKVVWLIMTTVLKLSVQDVDLSPNSSSYSRIHFNENFMGFMYHNKNEARVQI